jgi:hypothetical protein
MMPTCSEVARLLASGKYQDAELTRRALVRLHLVMCGDCARYAAELTSLNEAAHAALHEPLDPARLAELERQLVARMASPNREDPPSS